MATELYVFQGKALYPMLVKPDEFRGEKFWKIGLAMDEPSWVLFKRSGLSLKVRDHDEYGKHVVFKRKVLNQKNEEIRPPEIKGWNPEQVVLGNGSLVRVTVEVYDTKYGVKGHRLRAVEALEVVPFEGETAQKVVVHTPEEVKNEASNNTVMNDGIPF